MATKAAKKKSQSGAPNYFITFAIALAVVVGIYVFMTWERPSHKQEDLIGKWYYDTSDLSIEAGDGNYQSVSSVYYDFKEDGTWTLTNSQTGSASTGMYAIDGAVLTFNFDSGASPEAFAFVIQGNRLTLGEEGDTVELKRVK